MDFNIKQEFYQRASEIIKQIDFEEEQRWNKFERELKELANFGGM